MLIKKITFQLNRLRNLRLDDFNRIFWVFSLILIIGFTLASPVLGQNFNADSQSTLYGNSAFTCNVGICLGSASENQLVTNGECEGAYLKGTVVELVEGVNKILSVPGRDTACAVENLQNGNASTFENLYAGLSQNTSLISATFALNSLVLNERPTSGINFIEEKAYALSRFGVEEVNAQSTSEPSLYYRGTGFSLLKPIQAFWGWSVNIVYGLLIFLIIGIAFGIMFRSSLSGSVAVTLQNSIPNIAMAMILIPLSYAITGLFIDGITVGVNVVHQFVIGPGSPGAGVYENRNEDYPLNAGFDPQQYDRGLHADDIRVNWLNASAGLGVTEEISSAGQAVSIIFGINGAISDLFEAGVNFLAPFINFVIGVVMLFTGFRIFWLLFQKFIVFVIGPLFAPFVFATIAIPGNGTKSLMAYLKYMASGTLYYVVAYAMTLLAFVFSSSYFQNQLASIGTTSFIPPLLGIDFLFESTAGGQIPGGLPALYMGLIALGIYLMIPGTLKKIDKALGADKGFPVLGEIFQSAKDSVNFGKNFTALPGKAITATQKRAFGIEEGDYRSLSNILGRRVSAVTSRLDAAAERSKAIPVVGGVASSVLKGARSTVNQTAGRAATQAAGGGTGAKQNIMGNVEAGKKGGLELGFQWNTAPGVILVDDKFLAEAQTAFISTFNAYKKYKTNPKPKDVEIPIPFSAMQGPKLTIKATNGAILPAVLNSSTVSIVKAIQTGNLSGSTAYKRKNRIVKGQPEDRSMPGDIMGDLAPVGSLNPLIPLVAGTEVFNFRDAASLVIHDMGSFPTEQNRTAGGIKLKFLIPFFPENALNDNDPFIGLKRFMALLEGGYYESKDEIAIRINAYVSNPLKIRIDSQFVNSGNRIDFTKRVQI